MIYSDDKSDVLVVDVRDDDFGVSNIKNGKTNFMMIIEPYISFIIIMITIIIINHIAVNIPSATFEMAETLSTLRDRIKVFIITDAISSSYYYS